MCEPPTTPSLDDTDRECNVLRALWNDQAELKRRYYGDDLNEVNVLNQAEVLPVYCDELFG